MPDPLTDSDLREQARRELKPGGPMRLLRSLERGDPARIGSLPPFEAFIFNHGITPVEVASQIRANNAEIVRSYSYFNILERGDPAWSSPWFDFVKAHLPALVSPLSGAEARVPWGRKSSIFDWPRIGYAFARQAANVQVSMAPGHGIFADQIWLWPRWWMFDDSVAPVTDWPPHYWIVWHWVLTYYAREAQRIQSLTGQLLPALFNGDDEVSGPKFYEHAEWSWNASLGAWHRDYTMGAQLIESVLSVDAMAEWAVAWLLDEWKAFGGWIAFTSADKTERGQAAIDRAYERADELRVKIDE